MRILVLGIGGIGGTVAAHLIQQGAQVTAVSRNPAVRQAIASRGFRLHGVGGPRVVPGEVHAQVPPGPYDLALLATQPTELVEAAGQALPHLAADGALVCLPNGLPEERLLPLAGGPDRVLGAIVGWGANMTAPGEFERTSEGGFVLGRLDGRGDVRLLRLGSLLTGLGPVELADNLRGARWSKLAINAAISSLGTLGGDRLGALLRQRHVRRLALEVMTEVVEVARAEGVRLPKAAGVIDLDWLALPPEERGRKASLALAARHGLLLMVGLRYRRLRSSMLAAIERGRTPPVDFLNGEITARASRHGLPAPINAALQERIHALGRGEARPGHDRLWELYLQTRPTPEA